MGPALRLLVPIALATAHTMSLPLYLTLPLLVISGILGLWTISAPSSPI